MNYATLKKLQTERKTISDAAGAILTRAAKQKRKLTATEAEEWDRRMADVDAKEKQIDAARVEYLRDVTEGKDEWGRKRWDTRKGGMEDTVPAADDRFTAGSHVSQVGREVVLSPKVRSSLHKYLAFRDTDLNIEERQEFLASDARTTPGNETRALSAITGNLGGDTVPQGFVYTLDIALKFFGGIIEAADYIDTQAGNAMPYPTMNDTQNTGEVTAENQPVSGATGSGDIDPSFGVVTFNAYMIDSGIVLLPIQLVQDSAFNTEDFLEDALQTRIGRKLNNLATVGSGVSTLTGVVPSATVGITGASPTTVSYNELLGLEHALDIQYRRRPKTGYMFHDNTLLYIKKLVDGNGRPLFIAGGVSEGIQSKSPDTINGFPYYINNDMAQLGNGNKSLLFGDFSKFKIRRVRQAQIVRFGERYMPNLMYGYLCFQRFDSNIVDAGTHPIISFINSAT